jgi:hypothetical protein
MELNLTEQLNINGHLTISKAYRNGLEEVIFDDHNIIVSGMGVALAHLFALSGSNSILDYQIDRFQIGTSANAESVSTTTLNLPLTAASAYGLNSNVITASGYQIVNNSIVNNAKIYGLIPQHHITRVDSNTVRYTIVLDEFACNNLTNVAGDANIREVGLFVKNVKNNNPAAPILVAYRVFSPIRKTTDFSLIFRWSINF